MAEIQIGALRTQIEVTDSEALLSPQVMARIIAEVEAALARKDAVAAARRAETRIAVARGDGA